MQIAKNIKKKYLTKNKEKIVNKQTAKHITKS